MIISLTKPELEAAVVACSNYTGGKGWKQKTQARAMQKLRYALMAYNAERDVCPYCKMKQCRGSCAEIGL